MLFSSLLFIYTFLPAVLLLVLISPRTWHNTILLLASLIFYAWGGVSITVVLLFSILFNYGIGRWIERTGTTLSGRRVLTIGIVMNLLLIMLFKYADFVVDNLNWLILQFDGTPIQLEPIPLPLGISFFTFQAISYILDVYRGTTEVQRNPIHLGLYIALFPQLIAGPIVRYKEIAGQIRERHIRWEDLAAGTERFIIGLSKKVIIANNLAVVSDAIFAIQPGSLEPGTAWFGVLCYTLQLYFDFSGYTDMAIGLGRLFGFRIPENFNYPFLAGSIREFWQHWHITLGKWFRDYYYIPIGGNRGSKTRTYLNLVSVFFLVGLWHGAQWTFVLFGLFHGFFMLLERMGWEKLLKKLGNLAACYTFLVFMLSLVLFRSDTIQYAFGFYRSMAGGYADIQSVFSLADYLNREFLVIFSLAILGSTPVFQWIGKQFRTFMLDKSLQGGLIALEVIYSMFLILCFLYCTMLLASSDYNPFIYFRF